MLSCVFRFIFMFSICVLYNIIIVVVTIIIVVVVGRRETNLIAKEAKVKRDEVIMSETESRLEEYKKDLIARCGIDRFKQDHEAVVPAGLLAG